MYIKNQVAKLIIIYDLHKKIAANRKIFAAIFIFNSTNLLALTNLID
jgi:hypothetical protein